MPSAIVSKICNFLLIIVNIIVNFLRRTWRLVLYISGMRTDMVNNKKCKRNGRNPARVIDANWQKLLSSNTMMGTVTEKPLEGNERYTGTFRRGRKNKSSSHSTPADLNTNDPAPTDSPPHQPNREKSKILTKFIAMDCEMVGIGPSGEEHMLARVSLVNKLGECVYDKFVKPREEVKDYRTKISGVRKEDLLTGEDFDTVQHEVSELIKGRILVGHSLRNDLSVLFLSHPKKNIRDTARYKPFRRIANDCTPSLKRLAKEMLGIEIQSGEHSSVEDAKAVMHLYSMVAKDWEQMMSQKRGGGRHLQD